MLLDGVLPCMLAALLLDGAWTAARANALALEWSDPVIWREVVAPGALIAGGILLIAWLSLQRLRARAERPVLEACEVLKAFADGDYALPATATGNVETAALASALAETGARMREIVAHASDDFQETTLQRLDSLRDAQSAMRSKSRFLAEVSHHFRQPLQGLQLLVVALLANPDQPQRDTLARMQRDIARMTPLLDGLLELSQLDAGLVEPSPQPVAIAAVLERELAPLRQRAMRAQVRLVLRGGRQVLHTDSALLGRLLRQLVDNAIEHAPGRPVLVAARWRRRGVRIEVRDGGPGISILHQRRIFDEFVQLRDAGAPAGYGLGLAMASRLAALLGSRIDVRSEPGRGSTFVVDLPRMSAGAARQQRLSA